MPVNKVFVVLGHSFLVTSLNLQVTLLFGGLKANIYSKWPWPGTSTCLLQFSDHWFASLIFYLLTSQQLELLLLTALALISCFFKTFCTVSTTGRCPAYSLPTTNIQGPWHISPKGLQVEQGPASSRDKWLSIKGYTCNVFFLIALKSCCFYLHKKSSWGWRLMTVTCQMRVFVEASGIQTMGSINLTNWWAWTG